ncbi:butyrophilin-like protein 3 [Silurus meridionalis]|nr:butyrophilin-like protein 3 [Silurus meridionalis]
MFSENTELLQVVGSEAPLVAVAGEDLVLPCFIKAKTSAVDMTVEWYKLDKESSLVHLYKDHDDANENQAQTYRGRTSVFKEELQKGNTSLKLSVLRVSDEGDYRCLVENKSMSSETTVHVIVEVQGSQPVITMESYDNSGGINLVCESRGWKPEPEVLWLDREGDTLPAEDTQIHRDAEGFSVKRRITVYDYSNSNRFYCRLMQKHHMMETTVVINKVVIMDPDTANAKLILSDDGKQVILEDTQQNVPDSPLRFDYPSVLGKQSFRSGRFYYEVQVGNKTEWTLGVVKENIDRKNWRDRNPESGFWTITLRNVIGYRANADPPVCLTLREKLEKVGVFVDYEEGLVCFYNVNFKSHIYSFTEQTFTEKLYPYFSPRFNEGGQNKEPMIITDVTE